MDRVNAGFRWKLGSLTHNVRQIRFTADLSTETWQARKEWKEIFNMLNGENMQPRILYPASLESGHRIEGETEFARQTKPKGIHDH